ncbi:hypothetical protein [Sphaerisporangium sp. TRM90804]|uniref:hypothetical protein n=1 Tax=Sphaerisporangium sp. TRM90804 TaxID=3031113 RepID=UPI00244B2C9F|nr:hypothetical protein [Sphaerisporangium sp. TRM90804]MDH2427372.1 hypothetical protein [Sphaerisporangium sp. TRM90804]
MSGTEELVGRLARVHDRELAGQASATGARALLDSIVSGPGEAPALRRRAWGARVAVGTAIAGTLVAAVAFGPGVLRGGGATSYANSALDISLEGGRYVARITDPFADHRKYTEAFQAVGLDIRLRPVPVSPGAAGTILGRMITMRGAPDPGPVEPAGPRIGGLALTMDTSPPGCRPGRDDGCVMVMRIPAEFTGTVDVRLGRPARAGEEYADFDRAMAPGEMFAGVRLGDGRPVAEIAAEARRRGLTTVFSLVRTDPAGGGLSFEPLPAGRVGAGWTVWNAWQVKAGVIRLLVTPDRLKRNPFHNGSAPPPGS